MKKVLLSALLFAGAMTANAQKASIGATGGFGSAWMTDLPEAATFNLVGNVGATFVYSTDNHWGFGADVKYSREGVRYTYDGFGIFNGQTMVSKISLDYIRIPLRAIYFFNSGSMSIRPNASLGPNFGFLVGGESRAYDGNENLLAKQDASESFNEFDLGVQGTVGASFKVSQGIWFSADVAYYQGLLKQNKTGNSNNLNANLALNLGIRFGIGE